MDRSDWATGEAMPSKPRVRMPPFSPHVYALIARICPALPARAVAVLKLCMCVVRRRATVSECTQRTAAGGQLSFFSSFGLVTGVDENFVLRE